MFEFVLVCVGVLVLVGVCSCLVGVCVGVCRCLCVVDVCNCVVFV